MLKTIIKFFKCAIYYYCNRFIHNCCLFCSKLKIICLKKCFLLSLDRIFGLVVGVLILASLKYVISGGFSIGWDEFGLNFILGLFSGLTRILVIEYLREYLDVKGINYNVYQLLYGLNKQKLGHTGDLGHFKPKLYNCMDSQSESGKDNYLDKGKGIAIDPDRMSLDGNSDNESIERNKNTFLEGEKSSPQNNTDNPTNIDKGKGIDIFSHPNHPSFKNEGGPSSIFIPRDNSLGPNPYAFVPTPKTNPGPGFNVPGGKIPIRDPICQYIQWNSHILRQFRTMDLEVAIEQRNNHIAMQANLKRRLEYANMRLSQLPVIPTNINEANLRRQIQDDLKWAQDNIIESEAKVTMITSRIEFIQIEESKKGK